jgi:hypothetical protein
MAVKNSDTVFIGGKRVPISGLNLDFRFLGVTQSPRTSGLKRLSTKDKQAIAREYLRKKKIRDKSEGGRQKA